MKIKAININYIISTFINQSGVFIYRIYLNDNLYKTGKFVK